MVMTKTITKIIKIIVLIAILFTASIIMIGRGWLGHHEGPGTITNNQIPKQIIENRAKAQNISAIKIGKNDFQEYEIDKYDVLKVTRSIDDIYDYYLNMDNFHLQSYLKDLKNEQIDVAKDQYELAMATLGLILISDHEKHHDEKPLGEYTQEYSRKLSPLIMPWVRDIATV